VKHRDYCFGVYGISEKDRISPKDLFEKWKVQIC